MALALLLAPPFAPLVTALLAPAASAAPGLTEDTLTVRAGDYYEEAVLLPADGSAWVASARALDNTSRFDLYVIATTDLLGAYPGGAFSPLAMAENETDATLHFAPADRRTSYTLVVDNLDNARPGDAVPAGALAVDLARSPPLRSNPAAQSALAAGLGVCAAALAAATVAVAVFLKRRGRGESEEALEARSPRFEVEVPVPPPPKGSWALPSAPPEAEGEERR